MKRYITKFLKSLAAFFLVFPLVYIVLAAVLFDIPLNTCLGILLSPFYYVVTLSVVIAGYGLWEMQRWSWYLFLFSQILLGYENAIILQSYSESHNKLLSFLLSLFLQFILVYRVAKEIRVPYLFPKIRWWESNPRYKLSAPITLKRQNGESIEGLILDLSMAGCFVKSRTELMQDEAITLQFRIFNIELECEGISVWNARSAVTHPKGVGIKFNHLSKSQKKILRTINRRLRKIAALYRSSRYLMGQEEFLRKLKEIEAGVQEKA